MKKQGYKVYRSDVNTHWSVMNSVNTYLDVHPECEYYIITDPDIELDHVKENILEFYVWLYNTHDGKYVIGPMLRIDDIPNYYPKKESAIKKHKQQFWNKRSTMIKWNQATFKIQYSPIDTTFQLSGSKDRRKKFPRTGIRCYAPYSARHLDWYLNPNKLSDDQKYYSRNASRTAHWGRNIDTSLIDI